MVKLVWRVGYRLDSQCVMAWFPSGEKKFFTSPKQLQSGSEAYPVCYSIVTMWGSLPGSKATEAWSWLLTARHKFKNVQDILPLQHTSIFSTFMGPCIVIIFYYINPNKMHMLQSLFYLTTALHVLGVTITHLQTFQFWQTAEKACTILWALKCFSKTDIAVKCVVGGIHHPQHTHISSNYSTIAADNNTV